MDGIVSRRSDTPPIFKAVISATYKENLAYRSQMAISIFTQPIYFLVQYFIWQSVFKISDTVL